MLPTRIASITPAATGGDVKAFMLNTNVLHGIFIDEVYTQAIYTLVDLSGEVFKSGPGVVSYDDASELFYVQGADYFAWVNAQGDTIISIPSMAYSFD